LDYKTEQRRLIKGFFFEHPHEMFSAEEIALVLKSNGISLSAVYRNLAKLEEEGLILRCSKAGSRKSYYQYTKAEECKEHIHITCKKCGKTVHMEHEDTKAIMEKAQKYKNFALDSMETVFYGTCDNCQKA